MLWAEVKTKLGDIKKPVPMKSLSSPLFELIR